MQRDMQLFEYRSVRYWSKEIERDAYWGAKKIIFLIRDIDGPAMAAASMESCRFAALRSPLGSPRVGVSRVQSPTPRTRALPSVDTAKYRSSIGDRA